MKNVGIFPLIAVYLILVLVIVFRIIVHPTHYTTPDSIAYLKQANTIKAVLCTNFVSGIGDVKGDFAIWPIGYPFCIAVVSILTNTSVLVASKIVNLLFLGLLFILLYQWFGTKTWFVSLAFFSYGSLEVISETWSEVPFLFFVFLLCHIVIRDVYYSSLRLIAGLSIVLVSLFLIRYAGIVYYLILILLVIRYYFIGKGKLVFSYCAALVISSLVIVWYFHENKQSTGYYTGLQRVVIGNQSLSDFLTQLSHGLINEFWIARNHFFNSEPPDLLFIVLCFIQIGAIYLLVKNRNYLRTPITLRSETRVLLVISLGYLAGIVVMRFFVPFDDFDFRIFFPFTVPVFIGLLSVLTDDYQIAYFRRVCWIVTIFMFISLVVNLPKGYILGTLRNVVSKTSYSGPRTMPFEVKTPCLENQISNRLSAFES